MTHINDSSVDDTPTGPFGGEKNSGIGRFGGEWILQELTRDHWITAQHTRREYPFWRGTNMSSTLSHVTTAIEIVHSFFTSYNAHDVNRMLSLCSDNAELRYVPMKKQGEGRVRDVGKTIWSSLIDAFPDLRVTMNSLLGETYHVAAEVVIGGTQKKDFLNIPNQGKHYDLSHAFLLEINDRGLITRITA
jgi:predicted ester cyclase